MNGFPGSVLTVDSRYFAQLARSTNTLRDTIGDVCQIEGYHDYNQLIKINGIFSSHPRGEPTDRTGKIVIPIKLHAGRQWQYHDRPIDLESALGQRVARIRSWNKKINVMWSGGVDSTTAVNAFIKNLDNRDQLRVLYSPFSQYEHAEYLDFLNDLKIETVDISGTVYMDQFFDGIFITGDGGDESHASLDQSFLEQHGFDVLARSWRQFFYQQSQDQSFMDFCEKYFASAGREVNSVLEARWWFYINSKYRCMLNNKLAFWLDYPDFSGDLVQGFFDCDEFDRYISHRVDGIVDSKGYQTWKQDLKDYCYEIDGFRDWNIGKAKVNSSQLTAYSAKKRMMKNLHSLFVMYDGQRISTPNMPLFSAKEFSAVYGNSLDHVWNTPDQI